MEKIAQCLEGNDLLAPNEVARHIEGIKVLQTAALPLSRFEAVVADIDSKYILTQNLILLSDQNTYL